MAAKAGGLKQTEARLIQTIKPFSGPEARRVDEKRAVTRQPPGPDTKGPEETWNTLTTSQVKCLLANLPDNPRGRRDRMLISLLAYHGLRVSELASLKVTDFDPDTYTLKFFRTKTGEIGTHELRNDTLTAMREYLEKDALVVGPLFRGSTLNAWLG
jgi:integrase